MIVAPGQSFSKLVSFLRRLSTVMVIISRFTVLNLSLIGEMSTHSTRSRNDGRMRYRSVF